VLEDELHRRALEGWEDTEHNGYGELIRRVRRHSPALLIFSLKARKPGVYRDGAQVSVQATAVATTAPIEHKRGLTIADVLRFSKSLGDDGHQAVVDGLINAAQRRGELTPEYAQALSQELRRAEAAPSWAEHPGLLAVVEPPKDVER